MRQRMIAAIVLAFTLQPVFADVNIPNGGSLSLSGGSLQNIGSLVIDGTLDAGSGSISLAGDWTRTGTFVPGTSSVSFVDGGVAQATFTGDTPFHRLSLVSATGKTYFIEPAHTLSIAAGLTIRGLPGTPIQIANLDASRVAFVDLAAAGFQDIEFVGVSNVYATGQPLAADQTNQGGSGNDRGWFGSLPLGALPIPAFSTLAMLILALLMIVTATRRASPRNYR